jgi:hypothetical protein
MPSSADVTYTPASVSASVALPPSLSVMTTSLGDRRIGARLEVIDRFVIRTVCGPEPSTTLPSMTILGIGAVEIDGDDFFRA